MSSGITLTLTDADVQDILSAVTAARARARANSTKERRLLAITRIIREAIEQSNDLDQEATT